MANVYLASRSNKEEREINKYARYLFDLAIWNARDYVHFPHISA